MATPRSFIPLLLSLLFLCATTSQAVVPDNQTFTFVNEGEFGPYINEYDADYRPLGIGRFPFQLCFYNTTPNAYFLALRMGNQRQEPIYRWVWEANRNAPVRENATLTFNRQGNLILADVDGRVVWSTNTANKGVVGIQLLQTGNLVLYDNQGRFVWQSFDHPTDTLLVGQSLRSGGPTKLISRKSNVDGSEGPYSFVMESGGLAMYYNVNSKSLPYYNYSDGRFSASGSLTNITFVASPDTDEAYAYNLNLETSTGGAFLLARPKYNVTLSFLKIGSDGNLRVYTYYDKVDYAPWELTFAFFSSQGPFSGCRLPAKCGSLGVCEDEMCVACPQPRGLLGWSQSCASPKLPRCNGGANMNYYKVVGVENFLTHYVAGEAPLRVAECRDRCSKDCNCAGFFYWEESSRCWLAPVLGTLEKVSNSSHVAYIKVPK